VRLPGAVVLSAVLVWTPFSLAVADAITDAAQQGERTGQTLMPTNPGAQLGSTDSGGNMTLMPGSGNQQNMTPGQMFPGATGDFTPYTGVYGNDSSMTGAGLDAQTTLTGEVSYTGEAYRTTIEARSLSRPDMRNDPIWTQTDSTLNNLELLKTDFGDCTTETIVTENKRWVHIPDYKYCTRLLTATGSCTINHNVAFNDTVIDVYIAAPGYSYLTIDFDLKTGTWQAVSPTDHPSQYAIVPVVDYDALCVQNKTIGRLAGAWDWTGSPFPAPTDSTVWYRVLQEPTCDNQLVGRIQIEDTTKSGSLNFELAGRFSFRLGTLSQDSWTPQSCVDDALMVLGGTCTGTVDVSIGPNPTTGCMDFGGWTLCEGTPAAALLAPSPLPGISNLVSQVSVGAITCDYNQGQFCWNDLQGVQHCIDNTGGNNNTCAQYEANPQCGFISTQCVEGGMDNLGRCIVNEETWDCGTNVEVNDGTTTGTTTNCVGPVRCMGTECVTPNREQNANFGQAVAYLQVANTIQRDTQCSTGATSQGGDANIDTGQCYVFSGKAMECKQAVGGIVDCCETPNGISIVDYINLLMVMNKLDSVITSADALEGSLLRGGWETLRDPLVNSWNAVSNWFSSAWSSMTGSTAAAADELTASQLLDQFTQELMKQVRDWLVDTFGEEAANTLLTQNAQTGVVSMSEPVATALGWIATAYTIYVVTILVINIIWQCEDSELELGAKRELKLCHKVGTYCQTDTPVGCIEKRQSYCCFSSPLSRILNEQIRPQLPAKNWGTAKSPQCQGLTIDELASVDWSLVDISEWIALLNIAGVMPNAENLNMERLTGPGSALAIGGVRPNAQERAIQRIDGLDTTGINIDAGNQLR